MDVAWFKRQQKLADVTAEDIAERLGRDRSVVSRIYVGRQQMTLEQAKVFSEVFQQPLTEILKRAGVTDEPTAASLAPGFAESDVARLLAAGPEERERRSVAALLGARTGIDLWQVKTDDLASIGYLRGDFILVDTSQAERTTVGDAVIAQVYDRNGTATTVLRQHRPPVLVNPADLSVHVVDGNNVVIMGKITASWRTK